MKLVQAGISASKDRESSFNSMEVLWSSCKPDYVRETLYNPILTCCETRAGLFKCQ